MAEQNKNKRRGGGPKTPQGKQQSSQNSTSHGLRSMKVRLLGEETQEEYDAVVAGWRAQFEPADYQEEKLVDTLIRNDWLHRRAERWLLDSEASVAGRNGDDPLRWPAEERHQLELAQRYKTSAERAFYRSWSVLNGLRKDVMRESQRIAKLESDNGVLRARNERLEARNAPKQPVEAKAEAPLTRTQQIFGGQKSKTFTALHPSNEILIQEGQKKREKELGTGHARCGAHNGQPDALCARPCGNLPRPEERGGCECPTCSHNRAILEARAA